VWDALTAFADLRQDIRYAVRTMVRNPSFALVAIATLAIGIGATTAIFSVVHSILVPPLPYRGADRVVHIVSYLREGGKDVRGWSMSQRYFVGLRERAKTLSAIGGYDSFSNLTRQRLAMMVEGGDGAAQLLGTRMSPVLFSMLGAQAHIGRVFDLSEERTDRHDVIILSHRAWRTHFGGGANVLGRSLTLDGRLYSIVGVMPQDFHFPDRQTDFWIPLTPAPVPPPSAPRSDTPNTGYTDGTFGLLADGASVEMAAAEVEGILRQLDLELAAERRWSLDQIGRPASMPRRAEIVSMKAELVGPVRPALRMLSIAAALVLLIACANVLNLWLSRTAVRRREIAVKAALGAGRGRLVRQLVTESLVLAIVGGLVGIALAYALLPAIIQLAPSEIPRVEEIGLSRTVLAIALALTIMTGCAVGLIVALRAARRGFETLPVSSAATSESAFGRFGPGTLAVVGEIASALVLFVAAGLVIRSFITLVNVNPGYDARNVLTFQVVMPPGRYPDSVVFYEELIARLESMPAVEAAAVTDVLPIVASGGFHFALGGLPYPPGPGDSMVMRIVSRSYFSAMGIRVIEGRPFSDRDAGRRVLLVNREFARRYFGGESPVGRTAGDRPHTYEVIGVVDDVRHAGLQADVRPEYYVELREFALGNSVKPYVVVRTGGESTDLLSMVRAVVRQIDPQVGIDLNAAAMSDIVSASVTRPRFYTVLFGTFAAIAIALAAIGIYGVMAHSVAQRTREIGIRLALGARRGQVLALVLKQGLLLTLAGVTIGLGGAAAATRYLEGMLFGLTPLDPPTFALVSLLLTLVATLATYVPARRATRVDPVQALRTE
jgi:putative ABC transport system permease protein